MSDESIEQEELSHSQILADVEKQIKAVCKLLQRQATRLHDEQEEFDSMSKKMESMQFSSKVKLDVGGHHFTTTVQTLTKDPNSMLAAMFSGRFSMKASEDGRFFIDRDGTYFRYILNYLRDGKLSLPEGATFVEQIEAEAEFYQIQGILEELGHPKPAARPKQGANKAAKPLEESEILTQEHRKMLLDMLPYKRGEWRLLFRASRDGFEAEAFHSKCDNKGPTVTIVKSGSFIFGGFTEAPWKSPANQYKNGESKEAFLFSLVNPYGMEPVKLPVLENQRERAIVWFCSLGPTFGGSGGYNLKIGDKANVYRTNYSCLGRCYPCPEGKDTFLTGAKEFIVANYEVFEFY